MAVSDYDAIFDAAGREWNVDPHILRAIAQQESGGNPTAVSKKGATGLMGIMPGTGKDLGVTNLRDPGQSIYGGAKYISQLTDQFQRPDLALAAYNAGPNRMEDVRNGRATLPDETRAYVPAVAAHYQKFVKAAAPAAPAVKAPAVESDDDFLKRSGAVSSPKIEADESFLARTGASVKAPAPPPPQAVDEYGNVVDQQPLPDITPSVKPIGQALSRIGAAALQGYQSTPAILTPIAQDIVDQSGPVGRYITNPLLHIAGAVPAAANALGSGAAQAITEGATAIGVPALGRDLNMLAQVAPMAGMGAGVPRAPELPRGNALATPVEAPRPNLLAAPPTVPSPDFVPPGSAVPTLPRILQLIRADNEVAANRPAFVPPDAAQPPNPLSVQPREVPPANILSTRGIPVNADGAPASVGAAGTPASQSAITPREMLVNRAQAEQEKLNETQPKGQDTNRYVEGVNPTSAEMEQTVKASREQKSLSTISPDISDQARDIEQANTEARKMYFQNIAGSKTDLDRLEMDRSAQAKKDTKTAFQPGQTTDAGPVADTIEGILNEPRAKENTQLQAYIQPLLGRLYENDGVTLKSNPEQLYGLREDINRMRSRASQAQDKNLTHVSGELDTIRDALDGVISAGAPEYRTYMKNYADASRKIDEMAILQDHENGLNSFKTYAPMQRMMRKIVEARDAQGNNPYKSITDDTMQRLWALRDDLRRVSSAQDKAKATGSDSIQNAIDVAKSVLKTSGRGLAHAGLFYATNDLFANAMLMAADSAATTALQRRQIKRAREMLNPDPAKYPPPANGANYLGSDAIPTVTVRPNLLSSGP